MYLDWDHRGRKTISVIHTSGEDARDALNCRSLSVKEPLNIGKYRVLLRKETSKDKEKESMSYRVAKMHGMSQIAGLFSQKSH